MDDPPPAKQVWFNENTLPVASLSQHPDAIVDPTPNSNTAPSPVPSPNSSSNPSTCVDREKPCSYTKDGIYIDPFPVRTAGAPISTKYRNNNANLWEYLTPCGAFEDCELFETAEVMMTTGLSGKARTWHLRLTGAILGMEEEGQGSMAE
ncbi:hypothetical protein FRC12_005024 [Ceratobasidium sp. 428]|nr:hypothetical protein FRC12_005024 [Ceratobasidium sp. 428]